MGKKRDKSYTHPNIIVPSIPFCGLDKEAQRIVRGLAKILVEKTPGILHGENTVEAAIELLDRGLLRIFEDRENKKIGFLFFDFDKGKYSPLRLPFIH